jgi:hypothetical protein
MNWKIYHLCKMNDDYTVYDDNDNDNDNDYNNLYMYCISLLTPIIIISIVYFILN